MGDLPAHTTLINALLQCRQQKNLSYARRLYAYTRQHQLDAHRIFGNYLVPMLVECGSLLEARLVFDGLPLRNRYSWISLIFGYIKCGEFQHALHLHQKMQEDAVQPNSYTYVALLNLCARLKDIDMARELYQQIITAGWDTNPFVSNALVDMLGKCGVLTEAQNVFDKLPARDLVSWNVLIALYTAHGLGEEAMNCFHQMQLNCVGPDIITFICSLKACGSIGDIKRSLGLHAEIIKVGLERDLSIGNTLVDMYSKCGLLSEAHGVLDKLQTRDAVSWNALILGYAEHMLGEEALGCFQQMQDEGITPDTVTFVGGLKACSIIGAIEKGREIHAKIAEEGLQSDLAIGNTLVDMFGKCGSPVEAREVFDTLPNRDVVSWTALISGYAEHGFGKEALDSFEKMQLEGVLVNIVTLLCCLKACGSVGALGKGLELYVEITIKGLERDLSFGNSLVDMFVKCGSLVEAQEVFRKLPARDTVSWAALSGCADQGLDEEVLKCFDKMKLESVIPDAVTLARCLKSCGSMGALEKGREVHMEIQKLGLEKDLYVGNTLIDMYGKCGSVIEGQKVFDKMPVRDVISWNTMIHAYGENHEGNAAVQCFQDMQDQGIEPDVLTFSCLFVVCSHASLASKSQAYFKLMTEKYKIKPTADHYISIIDLLARSGYLYEAEKFAEKIEGPLPRQILTALLNACRNFGKVESGERYFQQLVLVDPDYAAAYSLMADAYAKSGRWSDAERLEELRKDLGAKKKPAKAIIELNERVHAFVVGHNQGKDIFSYLENLSLHMKCSNYVPNLVSVLGQICIDEEGEPHLIDCVERNYPKC